MRQARAPLSAHWLEARAKGRHGRTILAAIFDEVAFWQDESSANPDKEIHRAVMPALAASNGPLIAISTPYRKVGLLHERHKAFFGTDDPDILVMHR